MTHDQHPRIDESSDELSVSEQHLNIRGAIASCWCVLLNMKGFIFNWNRFKNSTSMWGKMTKYLQSKGREHVAADISTPSAAIIEANVGSDVAWYQPDHQNLESYFLIRLLLRQKQGVLARCCYGHVPCAINFDSGHSDRCTSKCTGYNKLIFYHW